MELKELIKEEIRKKDFAFLYSSGCYFTPQIPFDKIDNFELNNLNKSNFIIWVYKNYNSRGITIITDLFIYIGTNNFDFIYIYWTDLEKVSYNKETKNFVFNLFSSESPIEISDKNICSEPDSRRTNAFCLVFEKIISAPKEKKYLNRDKIKMDFNKNEEKNFSSVENIKDTLNKSDNNENILDSLRNDLIKSIIGIFKFIFYFVPKTSLQLFRSIFPTILKLLNVIILFLIWIQRVQPK